MGDMENQVKPAGGDSLAAKLCAACGMCCNGVLFYGTRLQPEDSVRSLKALGLRLKRKDGEMQFLQPCPAYKDACCSIYEKRPQRCRTFVCKQLQALNADESTAEDAFAKIAEAKILTDRVRDLFARLGDTRDNKAFARRYAAIFTPPLDSSPGVVRLRQELQIAMGELETMLGVDFRTEAIAYNR